MPILLTLLFLLASLVSWLFCFELFRIKFFEGKTCCEAQFKQRKHSNENHPKEMTLIPPKVYNVIISPFLLSSSLSTHSHWTRIIIIVFTHPNSSQIYSYAAYTPQYPVHHKYHYVPYVPPTKDHVDNLPAQPPVMPIHVQTPPQHPSSHE